MPQDAWPKPRKRGTALARHSTGAALALLTAAALLLTGLWRPAFNMVHRLGMSASADLESRTPSDSSRFRATMRAAQLNVRQGDDAAAHAPSESFLSFNVCGDWATQRVALLSGAAQPGWASASQLLAGHGCVPTEAEPQRRRVMASIAAALPDWPPRLQPVFA